MTLIAIFVALVFVHSLVSARLAKSIVTSPLAFTSAGILVYAFLSLTVVRMLPVAIALIGTRLSRATVLFMGWFSLPRPPSV